LTLEASMKLCYKGRITFDRSSQVQWCSGVNEQWHLSGVRNL